MMPPVVYLYPETSTAMQPMAIEFAPGSAMKEIRPRIGRTKTLDGGVHYDHRGLTDGDRNILIRTRITAAQTETLRGLMATGERFYLASEEALWLGHIARIADSDGDAVIEYWPAGRAGDASTMEYPDAYVEYSTELSAIGGMYVTVTGVIAADEIQIAYSVKSAVRWTSTIPKGATIQSAYATLIARYYPDTASITGRLSFHAADDSPSLPAGYSASEWSVQTSVVNWPISGGWSTGTTHDTPDVSAPLQEIVSRAGYSAGNDIMMFFRNSGEFFGRAAQPTPTLYVTYTV